MTVKFTTIERVNPRNPQEPRKHYPQIKTTGKTGIRQVAERAAEISTLSPADMAAAVEAFLAIVPTELANGNIVKLGDFGSFSLRTRGEGADTPEEVTSRSITKTLIRFRPGKRFKEVLDRIVYEKA